MQFRFKIQDGVTTYTDWYEETSSSSVVAYMNVVRGMYPTAAISVERRSVNGGSLPPTNGTVHLGGNLYLDGFGIIGQLANSTLTVDGGLL